MMTMVFRKFPSTPMYGSTRLTLHEDGRIIEQRDYYDLWGDIFNGVPYFKKPYRAFMRKFQLCRVCFRKLALEGFLPGVTKASW